MKTKKSTMDMVFCVCVSIVFMCVRLCSSKGQDWNDTRDGKPCVSNGIELN